MLITLFGAVSSSVMVLAYSRERSSPRWIAVFAVASAAMAAYGILSEAWILAALEAVWSVIAFHRWRSRLQASAATA